MMALSTSMWQDGGRMLLLPHFVAQSEIHELLALVYYDSLQSVVPFYDQRTVSPVKDSAWTMFCENPMGHFKKAFARKYALFSM